MKRPAPTAFPPRQPAGTPSGGQFAPSANPEAHTSLDDTGLADIALADTGSTIDNLDLGDLGASLRRALDNRAQANRQIVDTAVAGIVTTLDRHSIHEVAALHLRPNDDNVELRGCLTLRSAYDAQGNEIDLDPEVAQEVADWAVTLDDDNNEWWEPYAPELQDGDAWSAPDRVFLVDVARTDLASGRIRVPRADPWGEDPEFLQSEWRSEIAEGNTVLGYQDWVDAQHWRRAD